MTNFLADQYIVCCVKILNIPIEGSIARISIQHFLQSFFYIFYEILVDFFIFITLKIMLKFSSTTICICSVIFSLRF